MPNSTSLADTLRHTLDAARGNSQIRDRLRRIVADPARFEPLVRAVGPSHAVVLDLIEMARHGDGRS